MKEIHKTVWETYQQEKYGEVAKTPEVKKNEEASGSSSSSSSRRSITSSLNANGDGLESNESATEEGADASTQNETNKKDMFKPKKSIAEKADQNKGGKKQFDFEVIVKDHDEASGKTKKKSFIGKFHEKKQA